MVHQPSSKEEEEEEKKEEALAMCAASLSTAQPPKSTTGNGEDSARARRKQQPAVVTASANKDRVPLQVQQSASKSKSRQNSSCTKKKETAVGRGSLVDRVSAIMGSSSSKVTSPAPRPKKAAIIPDSVAVSSKTRSPKKGKLKVPADVTGSTVKVSTEKKALGKRISQKKISEKKGTTADATAGSPFLQILEKEVSKITPPQETKRNKKEGASQLGKLAAKTSDAADKAPPREKINKKKRATPLPKLSAAKEQEIKRKLAERKLKLRQQERDRKKQAKAIVSPKRKSALGKDDMELVDGVEQVNWFSLDVKDTSQHDLDAEMGHEEKSIKKVKPKKQLRSTVQYSFPRYQWTTRQQMKVGSPSECYYLHQVGLKHRWFDIGNLFAPRPHLVQSTTSRRRVYDFNPETLETILDRKEDKWWIKSRLLPMIDENVGIQEDLRRLALQEEDLHVNQKTAKYDSDKSHETTSNSHKGMEVLSIYFGPNDIDDYSDENGQNDRDDEDYYSCASVESVVFSDDEGADEFAFMGKPRENVEVMPGEFVVLRKEEETYEAIRQGTCMSSLCLGCGVALVSVQDALQVACPSCRAITPLNGICLHRPFGIATGVKRANCEHMMTPKKSIFSSSHGAATTPSDEGHVGSHESDDNRSTKVPLYIATSRTRAPARDVSRISSVAALGTVAMNNRVKVQDLKHRAGPSGKKRPARRTSSTSSSPVVPSPGMLKMEELAFQKAISMSKES